MEWLLVALVAGVVFVNGFTDAPNAVTGVVCAGTLPFGAAVALAASCNLAGLLAAWRFAPLVAGTVLELADFSAVDGRASLLALTGALLAVIVFALGAWVFGIPTSESHALLAALTGAALAAGGRVSPGAWGSVAFGLALSLPGGLCAGYALGRAAARWSMGRASRGVSVACAALMAALHGAQDGLKFMAVLLSLPGERGGTAAALLVGAAMGLGTLCGGRRIIAAVGRRMVALDAGSAAASDLAASLLLGAGAALGVPMSTTHTKTCAVLGAGAGCGARVGLGTVRAMALGWAVTFPVCGLIGWLFVRLAA